MTKEERAAKWDAEFIACKNHTERRCNRSAYTHNRVARCASCFHRNKDGTVRVCNKEGKKRRQKRYEASENGKAKQSRYDSSDKGRIRAAWNVERKLHG